MILRPRHTREELRNRNTQFRALALKFRVLHNLHKELGRVAVEPRIVELLEVYGAQLEGYSGHGPHMIDICLLQVDWGRSPRDVALHKLLC